MQRRRSDPSGPRLTACDAFSHCRGSASNLTNIGYYNEFTRFNISLSWPNYSSGVSQNSKIIPTTDCMIRAHVALLIFYVV